MGSGWRTDGRLLVGTSVGDPHGGGSFGNGIVFVVQERDIGEVGRVGRCWWEGLVQHRVVVGVLMRLVPPISAVLHRMSGVERLEICFANANAVWKVMRKSTLGTKLAVALHEVPARGLVRHRIHGVGEGAGTAGLTLSLSEELAGDVFCVLVR